MALKDTSQVSSERVLREVRNRISPLHSLTAERLRRAIDAFYAGSLAEAARIWEAAEARDDMLLSVAEKRKSDAAALDWTIGQKDDSKEAQRQKEVLEDFYNNIRVTSAVDLDQRGELALLIRQMMDARSKKYSVHEVLWTANGRDKTLRAEFRHVPLWFFERRTGRLRYLETEGALAGSELEDYGWLVMACPRALMEPCAKAYLVKTLGLGDMVLYSQKVGVGGVVLKTPAKLGSKEWEMGNEVLEAVGGDFRAQISNEMTLDPVNLTAQGQLPMPMLIDAMNRAMAVLWRGGDLSTISSGPDSTGASLQGAEIDALLADDAKQISGTLNATVDRWVLEFHFGRDAEPLAWFKLNPPQSEDIAGDRENAKLAHEIGLPLSVSHLREHFNLPEPRDDADTLAPRAAPADPFGGFIGRRPDATAANASVEERFLHNALAVEAEASAEDFRAVFERLATIEGIESEGEMRAALERFRAALPEVLRMVNRHGRLASEREKVIGTALVDGLIERRRSKTS